MAGLTRVPGWENRTNHHQASDDSKNQHLSTFPRFFQTIEGMMSLLEIENRDEARSVISQIDVERRTLPSNVMLYVSLKGVIGVILNVVVLFFLVLTGKFQSFNSNVTRLHILVHRLGSRRHQQEESHLGGQSQRSA
jgi:hypothetical protein